ncbi:S-adenosyl-L-methionine-dependent methyltransferase [Polychaeton citri CBS 116435]|uniref:type I protein arginine methyltransferase n=1 Tax=Polychaeton citri CBS 116435 TaxID=1314669 RepID=A0A9P4QI72_9PEZI|nr:S-adenosyl-L-methionine-dependent methyltransferase [Polychaeton citri CBS 116435]
MRPEEHDLALHEDSEGWDDVEDDSEELSIQCLVCSDQFPNLPVLLEHQKSKHAFDLLQIRKNFDLDFYGLIRFINYVRSYQLVFGSATGGPPDISDDKLWADEGLLQPVVQDDALLFCLDELDDLELTSTEANNAGEGESIGKAPVTSLGERTDATRVKELETELANITAQFERYRAQVAETLDARWNAPDDTSSGEAAFISPGLLQSGREAAIDAQYDHGYFDSYGTLGIHHAMLSDTVRTDAYRDFIYDNKALFKDKIVMDVGCGTGILSMFAARAGAKKVIAIDNSTIIDRARQIAYENGLADTISFHRGKVEDLQADQVSQITGGRRDVDIIVSEWMGYCLLFEAMLPSVLNARDRFLKRSTASPEKFEGVMAPSHCDIYLAPLSDEEFVTENLDFWRDVYGFDYSSLMEKANEDVFVSLPKAEAIVGRAQGPTSKSAPSNSSHHAVKTFNLYDTTVDDLSFTSALRVTIDRDLPTGFDGWCMWFNILFSPTLPCEISSYESLEDEYASLAKLKGAVTFSTSPFGKSTHWQAGLCIVHRGGDREKEDTMPESKKLKALDVIEGTLEVKKGRDGRDLEIFIDYEGAKRGWFVR